MGEISKLLSRPKRDLIFETQTIRKKDIVTLYDFYDSENCTINTFVKAIHLVSFYNNTFRYSNLLLYTPKNGSECIVTNPIILNFFMKGAYVYTTKCGVIIIFGKDKDRPIDKPTEDFFCSTIDMQEFNFHPELREFFANYSISRILSSENKDFVVVKNKSSRNFEAKELHSQINLQNTNSVSITFSDYM